MARRSGPQARRRHRRDVTDGRVPSPCVARRRSSVPRRGVPRTDAPLRLLMDGLSLTPTEIASGWVIGEEPGRAALPDVPSALTARAALEEWCIDALQHEPCVVAFS